MARVDTILNATLFKGPVTVASASTLTVNGSLIAASIGIKTLTGTTVTAAVATVTSGSINTMTSTTATTGALTANGVTTVNSFLKVGGETQVKSLYSGISAVVSGGTSVVVSTSGVNSASRIFTGLMPTVIASHKDLRTSVLSITENTSFTIQVDKATSDSQNVSWWVIEAQ